jgi:hypothetical protein
MKKVIILSCLVATVALTCAAETVELKSGERNEGTLKAITADEVVLEVAGQPLKFPRQNVSAIYFGAPPQGTVANPLNDALTTLKGLQSAVNGSVSYRDFAPRVTDAKIHVDQLLSDAPDGPAKTSLAEALGFYVYASSAWNANITSNPVQYVSLARNPLYFECEPLKRQVRSHRPLRDSAASLGIAICVYGVQPILECASEHVDTAERLVRGK